MSLREDREILHEVAEELKRILFLCKSRGTYKGGSFGLTNSAAFVAQSLPDGVAAKLVSVVDGNDVDREVTAFRPDIVILEAIWVTPEKLRELSRLHPAVEWIVRIHSKVTFLAQEGIAFEWIREFVKIPRVRVSANNLEFNNDLQAIGIDAVYLPNFYPISEVSLDDRIRRKVAWLFLHSSIGMPDNSRVHVGCFGAIRLLKNHLGQAVAAMRFAESIGRRLAFHINNDDPERTDNVIKNLRALFAGTKHFLHEHAWRPHDRFCELVSVMDICLQVSLSESFNIVTADAVAAGVPVVASTEVKHVHWLFRSANDTRQMVRAMCLAWAMGSAGALLNRRLLQRSNRLAMREWSRFVMPVQAVPEVDPIADAQFWVNEIPLRANRSLAQ